MSGAQLTCDKFKTIGEISKVLDVKQYIIRFWEKKFVQLKPIKRRGRRLYDQKNIEIIRRIKNLIYDKGYTIKGVQLEFNKVMNTDDDVDDDVDDLVVSADFKIDLNKILIDLINLRNCLLNKYNNGA